MQAGTAEAVNIGESPVRSDRRGTSRYPVREEVSYRVVQAKAPKTTGRGTTLNIGSGGILFTTEEQLPLGRLVELAVNWPARLGGTCPLKFVAMGRVVRSEANLAAVKIERYEFRTRGASALLREVPL
jgi:c-di-GMP-binding flagellar brake protein YcgR